MWPTSTKIDIVSRKDSLFEELHGECRQAAPGAHLSYRLQSKLEKLLLNDRQDVVTRTKDGCSPLFVACKRGNEDIVKYLVTRCNADVEQRGLYEVPEDRSTHLVTPLWCASVAGNLGVVKWLVQHGSAFVNSASDTGSTSVRSACFMTHLKVVKCLVEHGADILKPNYNGGTCLINSVQSVPLCEFLLLHGAAVNAQDIQFKTALHYAIQEHRFDTTKLLLEHGANPFTKSRSGDDALRTACLKGATEIFDYLIANVSGYDSNRVADAHELMGSTYLDDHHDIPKALEHWRKSIRIRGDAKINKNAVIVPSACKYLSIAEFNTAEELEDLALDLDLMRTQSLLICERILGSMHRDTIFRVMYRGAAYADSLQYQRCIDLWLYALRVRIQNYGVLHGEVCFTAEALVRLFLDLVQKNDARFLPEAIQYENIETTVGLLFVEFKQARELLCIRPVFKRQQDNFDRLLGVLTHLIYVLLAIPKSDEQFTKFRLLLEAIVRMDPRSCAASDTLLHLAVSRSNDMKANTFFEDTNAVIFPSAEVAEALLDGGMDINAVNMQRNTPLHVAVGAVPNSTLAVRQANPNVVRLLLRYGAHVDQRNVDGDPAYRLLIAASIDELNFSPVQHITLKCLSAQTIVKHNIHFKAEVPVALEEFIELH